MYTKADRFCAQDISIIYQNGNKRWKYGKYPTSEKEAFQRFPEGFSKYFKAYDEIINKIIVY